MNFDKLYKRTATGAIQEWYQEVEGDSWRTISGQVDGKKVSSEWHQCFPKNVGKKNATTAEQQAVLEVEANYTKRLDLGYFRDINDVDNPILFKPMLAKDYNDYKAKLKFPVYVQPKLDGMRCVVTKQGMFSRKGKRVISAPHIHDHLIDQGYFDGEFEDVVYDGELYNHVLKDNFDELMSLCRKSIPTDEDLAKSAKLVEFHVYDRYDPNYPDMTFQERYVSHILHSGPMVEVTTELATTIDQIDLFAYQHTHDGFEGTIVRTNTPYENKRTSALLKYKEFMDNEFPIVDIEEGVGNRAGMAGRITCRLPDGRTFGAGIKGSHEFAKKLLVDRTLYLDGEVTVRYFTPTPDGIPRFPVAVDFHVGKRDS